MMAEVQHVFLSTYHSADLLSGPADMTFSAVLTTKKIYTIHIVQAHKYMEHNTKVPVTVLNHTYNFIVSLTSAHALVCLFESMKLGQVAPRASLSSSKF